MQDTATPPQETDLEKYPNARILVDLCVKFFDEIQDLTPNKSLEEYLNTNYGPGNPTYEEFCKYVKIGLEEGWCATDEVEGPHYRRSKLRLPCAETRYFSLSTVYLESKNVFSGQYHGHPYGEINCVVPIDEGAQLKGLQGWQGPGWTTPDPGSRHFPQVRGGALVALFFLPAGRIAYVKDPPPVPAED